MLRRYEIFDTKMVATATALHRLAAAVLALVVGATAAAGAAAGLPPAPTAAVAQAQNVMTVTTVGTAVTAGLVSVPANPSTQFVVVDAPAHGSVTVNGATFTYTPKSGYTGTDSFHYVTADAAATMVPATITVQVLPTQAAQPSLASACTDLGPAFTPVCTAISDVTTPLVQACTNVTGSPSACSTLGGDKHGLVSTCFDIITGQPAALCKTVDAALQLVASQCRVIKVPTDICALYSGSAIGDPAIANYLAGPVHKALYYQSQLGLTLPLRDVLLPSTHNSFNYTNANVPPTLSGMDPDQLYSLTQQLDMDLRAIELDFHWFPHLGAPGGYAPILCHAVTNHLGCTFERLAAAGLQQIRGWLDAHPNEVIMLYVENRLDDPVDDISKSLPAGAAAIETTLGRNSVRDLIFRPSQLEPGGSCVTQPIPLDVSLAQIWATGKQVLMYSSGCGHDAGWDAIFFNNSDVLEKGEPVHVQYPDCYFNREQYQTSWTRFFDANTLIDVLLGGGTTQPMTAAQIQQMVSCGANAPGINFADPNSGQLTGFMWSWAYGQPVSVSTQRCAVHSGAGRFQAESCGQFLPYACLTADGWRLTAARGEFNLGPTACAAEFGGSVFAVPRNGYQNQLLITAKLHAGVDRAWLGYSDRGGGNWVAG